MPKNYESAALRAAMEDATSGGETVFSPGPLSRDEAQAFIELIAMEFPDLRPEIRWTSRAMDARCFDRRTLVNLGPKMLQKGEKALVHELAHALVLAEFQASRPHGQLFEDALARILAAWHGEKGEGAEKEASKPDLSESAPPPPLAVPRIPIPSPVLSFVEITPEPNGSGRTEEQPSPRKPSVPSGPLRRKKATRSTPKKGSRKAKRR